MDAYRYCLMERDGAYQWRWLDPIPEGKEIPGLSPIFATQEDAVRWHDELLKKRNDTCNHAPITLAP